MNSLNRNWVASMPLLSMGTVLRLIVPATLATAMAGCSMMPEWSQMKMPSIDSSTFALGTPSVVKNSGPVKPVTAEDLVDGEGRCSGAAPAPVDNSMDPTVSPSQPSLSRGVALQMTECEVSRLLGPPQTVEMQPKPGGERAMTMTYASGVRPGIYRFSAGRLVAIERVPGQADEDEKPKKKPAAKKVKKPANA
jgi:hypothetical protein